MQLTKFNNMQKDNLKHESSNANTLLPAVLSNEDKAMELQKAGDFAMRSCWECNPAHEYLKTVGGLFTCFECGRWYMNGGFFDNEEHCKKQFVQLEPQKFIKIPLSENGRDKCETLSADHK